MDTASHLMFGATLGGLALLDPAVAQQPVLAHAIMAATLVGSNAPDFDTIVRLKSYSAYIRIHRGVTHSIPALLIWPLLISFPVTGLFQVWEHFHLIFLWAMGAVLYHVLLDWFNVYGVQCFRPLSNKWKNMDILSLFEPFLFVIHGAGLIIWSFMGSKVHTGWLFLGIYAATLIYIVVRSYQHHKGQSLLVLCAKGACQLYGAR
ncbi:metal-dependent hydrolase [Paenibacillus sp. UNC451MF]|uniref:metal-dependent hydrolase n=1 Tax=Paenibacillus sp. UNC451MF TaxID=1449063 RepID=UPI00068AD28A|nr:metal-dependent hydrolase [Paenibacillus sp. UNC451MF]